MGAREARASFARRGVALSGSPRLGITMCDGVTTVESLRLSGRGIRHIAVSPRHYHKEILRRKIEDPHPRCTPASFARERNIHTQIFLHNTKPSSQSPI